MRDRSPARALVCAVGTVLLGLSAAAPAVAQVYDFDNVIMLSNQDQYSGYNDVWGFVGTNGREYVIQGTTTGTAWWDIDDPTNPVFITFIPGPGSTWRDMFTIGDYCYISTEGGGGIQIVDISDPTAPFLALTYNATIGAAHNIFGDPARDLVFVVGGFDNGAAGGLQVLDVTNPLAPVEIGQWNNRYIHDIAFENNLGYACLINDNRFRILDLTDPTTPANLGSAFVDPTGATHAAWPRGDGRFVYICEETTGGHVKKLDLLNPNAIVSVAANNPEPAASAHNVHVEGDKVWVSWYGRGAVIHDEDLNELGRWDTFPLTDGGGVGPGCWGVYPHLPSGVVAANGDNGLFLLRYEPDVATLDGTISSTGGSFLDTPVVTHVDLSNDQSAVSYKFAAEAGSNQIQASAFGHVTQTVNVTATANGTTTTDITLVQLPSGGISGTITEAGSGTPIEDVEVVVTGTPLAAKTDAAGTYSFPFVPSDPYVIQVLRYGYVVPSGIPVTVTTGNTEVVDIELQPAFEYENFAAPTGWTVDNEPSTTTGFWEFGEPFGTYSSGVEFQTELDHTLDPDDQCAVTGNANSGALGGDDVDNGYTRLLSPVYDLSGLQEPHAFFYRWYAVNSNIDEWRAEVTTNGGGLWTKIDSAFDSEQFWKPIDVDLTAIAGGSSTVQFRFTAEDDIPSGGQLVEAALDDFTIYDAATTVGVPLPPKAGSVSLAQNAPNPFPGRTEINFSTARDGHVEILVFNVRGARVATLVDERLEAGAHATAWDGRDFTGKSTAAGVYFYKLKTSDQILTKKMIRLR